MRSPRAVLPAIATLLATALLATGCTTPGDGNGDQSRSAIPGWPTTTAPVALDGLIWAADDTVHLPDDTTITVDQTISSYVVTTPGIVYFNADTGPDAPPLLLTTPDGTTTDTGLDPADLMTSPDGRWLLALDQTDGTNSPRELVAIDTTTGTEVLRTDTHIGASAVTDPDTTDWTDLYEDTPVQLISITHDTAHLATLDGYQAWDLTTPTAPPTPLDQPTTPLTTPPLWNPTHTWQIPPTPPAQDTQDPPPPQLQSQNGRRVSTSLPGGYRSPVSGGPDLESWRFTGWIDDDTALGLTTTTDPYDPLPVPLTCTVPSGDCELVDGTQDGVTLPLDRPGGLPPVYP